MLYLLAACCHTSYPLIFLSLKCFSLQYASLSRSPICCEMSRISTANPGNILPTSPAISSIRFFTEATFSGKVRPVKPDPAPFGFEEDLYLFLNSDHPGQYIVFHSTILSDMVSYDNSQKGGSCTFDSIG